MKQKLLEILLTALISASIAVLQAFAIQYIGHAVPTDTPVIAGIYGTIIHAFRKLS